MANKQIISKKEVLIVDDSSDISDVVALILKTQGFDVKLTSDGHCHPLIKSRSGSLAFILLDVLLSGADGRVLCREIKADPMTKKIPVIMFSAYPHVKASALEAGADAFLAKPFGRKDLLATIKKVLA